MSRRYSGTPVVVTSLWRSETVTWVSEVLWRTAGSFAAVASSVWKQNVGNRQAEGRSEGTHLHDATNPIEIRPPGCDCLTVVLYMEGSGEHSPFAPLDDMPLDLYHGAAIVILVNKLTGEYGSLARLTSSVVQPPRGWVDHAEVLLQLFPGRRIGRSPRKPVPVPRNPLR